ncbi:hypothetical protein [Saliphagus infecundisoli]|uniref:DUF3194 domain-containing protein n=1 Tax=Saliphagus infecundisoli TaxID=1849069 RepID=A0ABD5QL68_9EURY|nr:hypothetical protein [Saliphagus infecundisoli]
MTDDDETVYHRSLDTPLDLRTALESAAIEFLDVDEDRTVVIYQQSILMVTATEGSATTAQAFDVELWEPPAAGTTDDYETLLTGFVEELLAAPDRSSQ